MTQIVMKMMNILLKNITDPDQEKKPKMLNLQMYLHQEQLQHLLENLIHLANPIADHVEFQELETMNIIVQEVTTEVVLTLD